jgi:hypothetical protein
MNQDDFGNKFCVIAIIYHSKHKLLLIVFDNQFVTIYSYIMSRKEKLLDKAKNNPDGLSIDDFYTLMKHQGWILDHQRGSHQIWYSPKSFRLSCTG